MARLIDYALPDDRIVPILADACRMAETVSFTLVGGQVVEAELVPGQEPGWCPLCCAPLPDNKDYCTTACGVLAELDR
jgi:hypothetical protein